MIELKSLEVGKAAVVWRAMAVLVLAVSMFFAVLKHARKGDLVFCVTTPFTLPYAVVLAAGLRGAAAEPADLRPVSGSAGGSRLHQLGVSAQQDTAPRERHHVQGAG